MAACATTGNPGLEREITDNCEKILKQYPVEQPKAGANVFATERRNRIGLIVVNKRIEEFKKCAADVRKRYAEGK